MEFAKKDSYNIHDLVEIVKILREPGGCPWDREQTHESIRKNLIEETYEVAEAIDLADAHLLEEELGDLLLQILLHARMEEERGTFTFDDVCNNVSQKLVYRHPHVFKSEEDLSSGEVLQNWEKLKNQEKHRETAADRLDSVPACLPALMRSGKLQKRAADFGFSYSSTEAALRDLQSEVAELAEAIEQGEGIRHEVGDVLFSAVNVARQVDVDAEEALTESSNRFAARVKMSEQLAVQQGKELASLNEDELDVLWKQAKQILSQQR